MISLTKILVCFGKLLKFNGLRNLFELSTLKNLYWPKADFLKVF